jgi:hypothetical protein
MFTAAFWKGLAERAIKTFAASLAGLLGTAGLGLLDVDWGQALSVSGLATLVTVLLAVANPDFVAGRAGTNTALTNRMSVTLPASVKVEYAKDTLPL